MRNWVPRIKLKISPSPCASLFEAVDQLIWWTIDGPCKPLKNKIKQKCYQLKMYGISSSMF